MTNTIKTLQKEFSDNNPGAECLTVMTANNYDVIDISLPKNFFEQIITYEIELSEEFKYEKLEALVQLYLKAIQYYSSKEPQKKRAYQNRMEYLLTQKDTLKNLSKLKNDKVKSSKSSNQIRGRAKTKFMMQSKAKKEDIKNRVNEVITESKNIKENKKSVKILINNEFESQSKKWKEKLAQKKNLRNSMRPFLLTSQRKFFNTPGPNSRKSLNIENNKTETSKFEKSGKIPKYGEIDDDSEDDNKSDNADVDFLKMFKEKHSKDDNKKDSDEEGSIIDDNYNDDNLDKIEEVEEENIKQSEKNVIKNINEKDKKENVNPNKENKIPLKGILKKKNNPLIEDNIKEENEEENKVIDNNESRKEQENNLGENNINNESKKEEDNNKEQINNESKKEEEKNNEEQINEEAKKEKEEENDSLGSKDIEIKNNDELDFDKVRPLQRKKSIVDENVIREIEPDDEIKNIIEEKMKILDNLKNGEESEEDSNNPSSTNLPTVKEKVNINEIPPIFQAPFLAVEEKMKEFVETLKNHFYKETFDDFSLKLKDLYDSKYKKYIMVNNEYHSSITEKEYLLENEEGLNEEKKIEIQNIIDSLKEEQKDQIDKIVDEYNNNIILLINEFKQNSFKKNIGIQLLEEQLKLDIYSMINEAFY
jgi:hypothetical protein